MKLFSHKMGFYSYLEAHKDKTKSVADIEDILDGNLCRCTGYRPILDAFKSFANGSDIADLEDFPKKFRCQKKKAIGRIGENWFMPTSLDDLVSILDQIGTENYRLVLGNTGRGIYDSDKDYEAYVSLKGVGELFQITHDPLTLGAGVSLNQAIEALDQASVSTGFHYAKTLANHLKKVAHPSVRNVGSLGGNLMLKHQHPDFPSDVFLLLETAGCAMILKSRDGSDQ